ncbi:MAG: phosphoribosylglycinamide formyltransferase, partial [Neisseriaceae bacterium]
CVISNNPEAKGLQIAKQYSITSIVINNRSFANREEFEKALIKVIDEHNPKLIVLAGFMRILSPFFVNKYPQKIINIHPSLLPSFIGVNAQQQAFNTKVKVSGATVHFVTNELDYGPIIAQGAVPILENDDCNNVANKILTLEHKLYPFVIKKIINDQVKLKNDGYVIVEKSDDDSKYFNSLINYIFY